MRYAIEASILMLALVQTLTLWRARDTIWPGVVTVVFCVACIGIGATYDRAYYLMAMLLLWAFVDRWGGLWRPGK